MRAARTITVSILALGLLAGSALGVAAQSDDGVTVVSGQPVEFLMRRCPDDVAYEELPPTGDYLGGVRDSCEAWRMDFDDDRLDGVMLTYINGDRWAIDTDPPGEVSLSWGDVTLGAGKRSRWVGTYLRDPYLAPPAGRGDDTVQLTGTGDYAGLSAVLRMGPDGIEGIVFPGSLPPAR